MNNFLETVNSILGTIDDLVWGIPLIVLILAVGIFLTIRSRNYHVLSKALSPMRKAENMEKFQALELYVLLCLQPLVPVTL